MGDLQAIGYGGQPVRDVFRRVDPPMAVLVDLTALFPRQPHGRGRYHPNGLQMAKVIEGQLTWWALCEQGAWWGLVTYPIRHGGPAGGRHALDAGLDAEEEGLTQCRLFAQSSLPEVCCVCNLSRHPRGLPNAARRIA